MSRQFNVSFVFAWKEMLAAQAQKEAAQDELGHRLSCNGKNVNLFADLFEFRFRIYKYF